MRPVIAAVVALACVRVAIAGGDRALDQARRDVDSSDYLSARSDLVSALNAGTASRDELAEIYKLTGIVEAALGNGKAATDAFARWIELDHRAELPAGTSPKITRPFQAASRSAPAELDVKPETRSSPPHLTIVVNADPLHLVARARAFVSVDGGPERKVEASGKTRLELDLPPGRRLDIRAEVLDVHGNQLAQLGSRDVPIVITPEGEASPPPHGPAVTDHDLTGISATTSPSGRSSQSEARRPLYLSHWLWGGAAVALAAGGTYFGLQARDASDELRKLNADSQAHSYSEAASVQSRGDRDALLCNVGLISAGAVAVVAGVLWFTAPRAREAHVAAVPVAGGGAVVLGGAF